MVAGITQRDGPAAKLVALAIEGGDQVRADNSVYAVTSFVVMAVIETSRMSARRPQRSIVLSRARIQL
jgi:hypothetical protein